MQQLFALFSDRLFDRRMTVAQRVDTDSAQQIEVAVSLVVNKVHTFAANEQDGIALVGLEQEFRFSRLHGRHLGRSEFEYFRSVVLGHATSTSVPYAIFALKQVGHGRCFFGGKNANALHAMQQRLAAGAEFR